MTFTELTPVEQIVALRFPGEIVLSATTETWKGFRRRIEQMSSEKTGELSFLIREHGQRDQNETPLLDTLFLRQGTGLLKQFLAGSTLVIEGSGDNLLALAENIDFPNPFEGAHYHSDSLTPEVAQNSVALVFSHEASPSAHALDKRRYAKDSN